MMSPAQNVPSRLSQLVCFGIHFPPPRLSGFADYASTACLRVVSAGTDAPCSSWWAWTTKTGPVSWGRACCGRNARRRSNGSWIRTRPPPAGEGPRCAARLSACKRVGVNVRCVGLCILARVCPFASSLPARQVLDSFHSSLRCLVPPRGLQLLFRSPYSLVQVYRCSVWAVCVLVCLS